MAARGIVTLLYRLLLGVNAFFALGMLVTGYSHLVDPVKFPLLATVDMAFPLFLVANILFFFFWLFLDRKTALLPIATLLVCYSPVRTYIGINMPEDVPEGTVKVMSYNVLNFHGMQSGFSDEEKDDMVAFLVDSDCDILCLQEASETAITEEGRKRLAAKYPYNRTDTRSDAWNAIAIYSKYEILNADTIEYESKSNMSMAYILATPASKTLVVNNHLETSHLSLADRKNFKDMITGDVSRDSIGKDSRNIIATLTKSSLVRNAQVKAVARYIEQYGDMPVVVCGDFNDTPTSFNHSVMNRNLTDCFVSSGIGPGWSYCHGGLRVRIDNILCSQHFQPYGCKVLSNVSYSDHYPIVCWLKPTTKDVKYSWR